MTRTAINKALKPPLEDWCLGGGKTVKIVPENAHTFCKRCGRLVSIIDGKLRRHRNLKSEKRYAVTEH